MATVSLVWLFKFKIMKNYIRLKIQPSVTLTAFHKLKSHVWLTCTVLNIADTDISFVTESSFGAALLQMKNSRLREAKGLVQRHSETQDLENAVAMPASRPFPSPSVPCLRPVSFCLCNEILSVSGARSISCICALLAT